MSESMSIVKKVIASLITIIVLAVAIPILYPMLVENLTAFGDLGNFTFSGLFGLTGGIVVVLLSAGLLGLLIVAIMKIWGKGR